MFAGALFDMDGLLIDSERVIMAAWLQAARGAGVPLSAEAFTAVIGRAAAESEAILAELLGGREAHASVRASVERALGALTHAERYPIKPGAAHVLQQLAAAGVPCAVASSSSRAEIEERLASAGVLHHFAAVAGGDEVPRGKPDPAVYQLAASRAGVASAQCLAFEDSVNGARSALASGAALVLVPDLVRPPAELAAQCLAVLGSLGEALPRLGGWFPALNRA